MGELQNPFSTDAPPPTDEQIQAAIDAHKPGRLALLGLRALVQGQRDTWDLVGLQLHAWAESAPPEKTTTPATTATDYRQVLRGAGFKDESEIARLVHAETGASVPLVAGEPWTFERTEAFDEVERFRARPRARILALGGGRGCGKTFAALWLIMVTGAGRIVRGGRFGRHFREEDMEALVDAPGILLVDDVGTGDWSRGGLANFEDLLKGRELAGRRTVLTSDLPAHHDGCAAGQGTGTAPCSCAAGTTFRRRVGERVWSLVAGGSGYVECPGRDLRCAAPGGP